MGEKIEVGYAKKKDVDFGNLMEEFRDGTIKVDKEAWYIYVKKRAEFEQLHTQLMRSLPKKYAEKISACPICGKTAGEHSTGQSLICHNKLQGDMAGT